MPDPGQPLPGQGWSTRAARARQQQQLCTLALLPGGLCWSNSRGCCQAGAWHKSENFLTVTNACLKKNRVYLSVVRSISLSFGKAVSLLPQSALPFAPLLRKRIDNVLL